MNRRQFAKAAALVPLGLACTSTAISDQAASAHNQGSTDTLKKAQAYNRHLPINEGDPFAEPISFVRKSINPSLQSFLLGEVALEPGPFRQAAEWNRKYMMRLPNSRLLHNFRVTAGLPSSAKPLGGWEAPDEELRGHFVGHYLSAAALLCASTGDSQVKSKADELVAEFGKCQAHYGPSGYLSAFPEELFDRLDRREKVWAPFYTLHKIMAGLLDMHTLTGNEQARDVLLKLAGWVDAWTGSKTEEHMQDILNTEYGGMNDVLYSLAAVTSDDRWARTGDRFTKKKFFNPLAMRKDELKGLHVNTHIPQVIGAATRYSISSDRRFREVAEFFWETVSESRTYATGGSGNTESWLTNANRLALEIGAGSHHQECCCAYNMMKLTRQLFSWTGDPKFIDYYERNLFNHRLGTIEPDSGLTTYFLSMSPGAWKTTCTEDQTFWCCTGTALEEFAKLNDAIYFHDGQDVFVNLFISSQLRWSQRGIRLKQSTNFPESDRTMLTIETSPSEAWTMHLRIPAWTTSDCSVRVNNVLVPMAGSPGSRIALRRRWRAGDQVEFVMPMRLTSEPLPDDPSLQAFRIGPIVLAAQFPRGEIGDDLQHNQGPEMQELPHLQVPTLESRGTSVDEWIKPVPDKPLCFRTAGQAQDVSFKPLNQSWERFAVYLRVS